MHRNDSTLCLSWKNEKHVHTTMSQEEFEQVAKGVKECSKPGTNEELLELYGFYKQATVGDNNTGQPWALQIEARAKWDAWTKNKGMSQADARARYIEFGNKFIATHK